MKIDFKTVTIGPNTGYGNASRLLVQSLKNQGVEISPGSSVMLNFCMPPDYEFSDYTIGYTPWESTEVPKSWVAGLKAVDDLWVTSPFVKNVFSKYRDPDSIFVVPHGIENCWTPFKHQYHGIGVFEYIHVGEPATRKGGDIVLEAWHKAFKDRKDVRLTFKCNKYPIARIKDSGGSIVASPGMYENVRVLGQPMTQTQLWLLYSQSHCMVYPTRGEGFGLIPFEAIGSGLPTIVPKLGVSEQYNEYATMWLTDSRWVESTQEWEHPGLWLDHDVDELIDQMLWVKDRYYKVSEVAFRKAQGLHQNFAWDEIAERMISRLPK